MIVVPGIGPRPASILALGEAPGKDEEIWREPFVGRSGEQLNRYWGRDGIPLREEIYLTNVVKQRPVSPTGQNRPPTPDEIRMWLPHLCSELQTVQPELILTLGKTALSLFLDLDMEAAHAIPHDIPIERIATRQLRDALSYCRFPEPGHVRIYPTYHPAFALHDPTMQSLLTYDFERLGQYLKGLLPVRHVDDDSKGIYELIETPRILWPSDPSNILNLGLDTEGYLRAAWGLSYSDRPGRGYVMRASDAPKLARELERRKDQVLVILHHALHDLPVLREMGIDLVGMGIRFTCTMVESYLLGLEPQGLKPLAYRHAGMQMGDYQELTGPTDERVTRERLMELATSLPPKQIPKSKRKKKDAPIEEYDPMTARLAHAGDLLLKMLAKDTPIRKRWNDGTAREILVEELALVADPPYATLDEVIQDHGGDPTRVIDYAGGDADGTRRIHPTLRKQITAYGLDDALETTIGILPMVDRMQMIGMKVNLDHFRAIVPILDGRAEEIDAQIEQKIGYRINADSGDQVALLLFDKMRLHKKAPNLRLKRTDTGRYSTDDKSLEALKGVDPIVGLIRDRREMTKLKSSYALAVPRFVDPRDGRLHCELKVTRTDTGRLAAADPNLLAFPKHSEWGMLIRYGFVAEDGHEYGAWDMDQIEMKVFADNADEYEMLLAFAAGVDLHASTAGLIFGRTAEMIYQEYKAKEGKGGEQRFAAKAVNFGILMGITAFGLLDQFHKNGQLHWTLDDCEKLLAEWRRVYARGAAWIKAKHEEARRFSYVRDMFGRLRWLDGVHSEDEYIRLEAERMAQSTPVQSGAQGIMQRVMRNLWPDIVALRKQYWVEPLLQTHDELLFEYDRRYREDMNRLVLGHMGSAVTLKVPVTAKGSYGANWGEVSA